MPRRSPPFGCGSAALRRRLLRELVWANLEERHGLLPRSLRRSRVDRAAVARVVLVAIAIVLGGAVTSRFAGSSVEVQTASVITPAEGGAPAALSGETALAGEVSSGRTAALPRPIDAAVLRLGVRKIVLDPGHGGIDPGARTRGGRDEKDLALDIARRLARVLRDDGFEVAMTRERDETVSLRDRSERANAARGDLFVSIHLNSIPIENRGGLETYYLGPPADARVERLAGVENARSGYSLTDLRAVLERVYANVHADESRRLAGIVHRKLYDSLRQRTLALEDRGVKTAPFVVLVGTKMPGILAEVSSMSNQEEAALLESSSYRQRIAEALGRGVRWYAASYDRRHDVAAAPPEPVASR